MKQVTINKPVLVGAFAVMFALAAPISAFAHVVITPNEALTGAYQTFTTSVPNEKDISVTGIRLIIPESVESVTPTVKPGWEIQTKKSGDKTIEITWTGGTIPAELRDEFTFSAHLPSQAGDINWKAYQTYQDGSVVSWDQKPAEDHSHESEDKGPYSTTTVSDKVETTTEPQTNSSPVAPYIMSILALALSVFALVRNAKK